MTRFQRRKKAIYTKAIIDIYAEIAIALHKQHGWGKKRISRLLENQSKTVTIEDILDVCKGLNVNINR